MTRLVEVLGLPRLFFLGAAAVVVTLGIFLHAAFYPVEVILHVRGQEEQQISSRAKNVEGLLQEQGLEIEPGDRVVPSLQHPLTKGLEIELSSTFPVEITVDGESFAYNTSASNVQELLAELGFPVENAFDVSPPLNTVLQPGDRVELSKYRVAKETEEVEVPFKIAEEEDEELPQGRTRVLQEGESGLKLREFKVLYDGEEEVYRQLEDEELIKEPVKAVVAVGTKKIPGSSGQLASRSGSRTASVSEGYASWYGPNFHGRRTASGEIYNQNAYTAAHNSLPFGTEVKVTFLRTGRSVMVRINDRGPFVGNRIIDLSRRAAEEIGLRPHGIGRVRLEVY